MSQLADDPPPRVGFVTLVAGSCLRMHEDAKRANQPMLPVMRGDDRDALYLLLVVSDESGMSFKCVDMIPAMKSGSINQQSDVPMLLMSESTCGPIWRKSSAFNLFGNVILNTLAEMISVLIMEHLLRGHVGFRAPVLGRVLRRSLVHRTIVGPSRRRAR
jgi:hypothetical protein